MRSATGQAAAPVQGNPRPPIRDGQSPELGGRTPAPAADTGPL